MLTEKELKALARELARRLWTKPPRAALIEGIIRAFLEANTDVHIG